MIQITPQMRVLVAIEPADFRRGIDGLARHCRAVLNEDPFICGDQEDVAAVLLIQSTTLFLRDLGTAASHRIHGPSRRRSTGSLGRKRSPLFPETAAVALRAH
jgi:hypothetical protein